MLYTRFVGPELLQHLQNVPPAERVKACQPLLGDLAQALRTIHALGIVHRSVDQPSVSHMS